MALFCRSHLPSILRLHAACSRVPYVSVQLRWKKIPRRKPTYLPTAPSKLFRIPQHPYVPPEEQQLIDDLMVEYYTKRDSLRAMFQEELAQKYKDEGQGENQNLEEEKFLSLLEENKKENERLKKIREETMERLFQEKQLELLQLEEERKIKEQETKLRVDEIVRKQKEKMAATITYENLEEMILKAIDDPRNVNFSIDVNGTVKWEGTPPDDLEAEIRQRVAESMKN